MGTEQYINEVLGRDIRLQTLPQNELGQLPLYLKESYRFKRARLFDRDIVLLEPKSFDDFSILQTEKQLVQLRNKFGIIVLLLPQLNAYNRQRLINKHISFIVPGKQLYLPELLTDLRETDLRELPRRKEKTLLPSAQFLVLHHILHRYARWKLENRSFKDIAQKTGYTQTAITKAVENLRDEELINVKGEKEKHLIFRLERGELWNDLIKRKLLASPILRTVYVDDLPEKPRLLPAGTSALPEYSDMNPSRQKVYAVDKAIFYEWQEKDMLGAVRNDEGRYTLEIWKYSPERLVDELPIDGTAVDPLSLFLSLKDHPDERIDMALDQIINTYINI